MVAERACSLIVKKSASVWVGCHLSVSPLKTGTVACWASSTTVAWLAPRYSIASKTRDRTLAVSAVDSLCPIWLDDGSRTELKPPC